MEEMMQEMARMRMDHRMNFMTRENEQMMALMHKVMGHLKEMEGAGAGKDEMGKMMHQMDRMKTRHQEMMGQ